MEYFCNETDQIWKLSDKQMTEFATNEAARIGIIDPKNVEDCPCRFAFLKHIPRISEPTIGSDVIRNFLDRIRRIFT